QAASRAPRLTAGITTGPGFHLRPVKASRMTIETLAAALTGPAGTDRRSQRGPVLMLLHGGGLECRVFFRRWLDTGQFLAANPDGDEPDDQAKQRDCGRGEEPAGEAGG